MKELEVLVLDGCPIVEEENYRDEIFKLLPHLKYIDGKDSEGNFMSADKDSSDNEGIEAGDSDQENSNQFNHHEDSSAKIIEGNNDLEKEESKYYNYPSQPLSSVYDFPLTAYSNNYPTYGLEEAYPSLASFDYQFESEDLEDHNVPKRNNLLREDSFGEFPVDDQGSDSDNGKFVVG